MCRASDQEMKLRFNTIVQELVDGFRSARPVVLQLGMDFTAMKVGAAQGARKRKMEDPNLKVEEGHNEVNKGWRHIRSQQHSGRSINNHMSADQATGGEKDIHFHISSIWI